MKSHKAQTVQQDDTNVFVLPQPEALSALGKNMSVFGERLLKLQQESVRFMGERFEDNMKTFQRVSACRSLPDLLAAQQKWFAETAQAYSEEWSRCTDLLSKSPNDDDRNEGPTHR